MFYHDSWQNDICSFKTGTIVYASLRLRLRCLGRQAPSYLADYCVPVSTVPGRQHLRSASRRQLIVPRVRRSIFGARAFAIAGPTVWNSLPDSLRDPAVGPDQFRRDLKTHLFVWHCVSFSALAVFSRNALYKSTFYLLTYLLTYLLNENGYNKAIAWLRRKSQSQTEQWAVNSHSRSEHSVNSVVNCNRSFLISRLKHAVDLTFNARTRS